MPSDAPAKVAFCPVIVPPYCGSSATDFGRTLAVDGDTAVVGYPHADSIHIFELSAAVWSPVASFEGPPGFGDAVDLSEELIAVGVPGFSEVRVLVQDPNWHEHETIRLDGSGCFGRSVQAEGGRIVVGDPCASRVSIFVREADVWSETIRIELPGIESLGGLVALSGDLVAATHSEGVYSFDLSDAGWSASSVTSEKVDTLGVGKGRVAVTAHEQVHVHERLDGIWTASASFGPRDGSPFARYERFGWSLAISGDTILVGAPLEDPIAGDPDVPDAVSDICGSHYGVRVCLPPRPGAAYVFEARSGSWEQTTKVMADSVGDHTFGSSVAIDQTGRTALVGASGKYLSGVGSTLDVDPEDSVHIFTRLIEGGL